MSNRGFTLIELLVVVAIIGILASIAIPQFSDYKKRAFDSRSRSDLRNMITAQEGFYIDSEIYADTESEIKSAGFVQSDGVVIYITASDDTFELGTSHASGSNTYCAKITNSTSGVIFSSCSGTNTSADDIEQCCS